MREELFGFVFHVFECEDEHDRMKMKKGKRKKRSADFFRKF